MRRPDDFPSTLYVRIPDPAYGQDGLPRFVTSESAEEVLEKYDEELIGIYELKDIRTGVLAPQWEKHDDVIKE